MPAQPARVRRTAVVRGLVQGVGFRPYVHALAHELGLSGRVANTAAGVHLEVEGAPGSVAEFADHLPRRAPPLARIEAVEWSDVEVRGGTDFTIVSSEGSAGRTFVSPDVATCGDCLAELRDPDDRRHRHPFITCTNCGPRYTIVTGLPYDRPNTTMGGFEMCPACEAEYVDPADRRFHAQPLCCPDCGPRLRLTTAGEEDLVDEAALARARRLVAEGAVVAVKGLGGYHLACDATSEEAVAALRKRKDRGDKPFAVLVPDLDVATSVAEISASATEALVGHHRPIVLVPQRGDSHRLALAGAVAPGNPDVGLMLPPTALHVLLLGLPDDPPGPPALVLTSGNLAGAPIVTGDQEAQSRLAGIAEAWLGHDRAIHVPCDDSVVRVVDDHELPVRRSRGYAPLPVRLPRPTSPVLAVGGDLKNTFCLAEGHHAWLSAHVGDMDDLATQQALERAEAHLEELVGVRPRALVADRHPGYRSRRWAEARAEGRPVSLVQHHHAHVASTLADNHHPGDRPVIGIAFDGTGYGDDGAVWGGECLVADYAGYRRAAHLAYVPLPGGDAGVDNPCRMALSHLHAAGMGWDTRLPAVQACTGEEIGLLTRQLETGFACVPTSSMGRLFDAVSSLLGVRHRVGYEAQAAIELEGLARSGQADDPCGEHAPYAFTLEPGDPAVLDPGPVLTGVCRDVLDGVDAPVVADRFHRSVVAGVRTLARHVRAAEGLDTVTLSGGVFLNALLTRGCASALAADGFRVLRHHAVPPSDAGLALGQVAVHAHGSPADDPRRIGEQAGHPPEVEQTCA